MVGAAELKTVPLFASLNEDELRVLASWFDVQACSEGVCLTGEGRRSATVTTTAPSRLLVMFGTEFRQLQRAQPSIAEAMQQRLEFSA